MFLCPNKTNGNACFHPFCYFIIYLFAWLWMGVPARALYNFNEPSRRMDNMTYNRRKKAAFISEWSKFLDSAITCVCVCFHLLDLLILMCPIKCASLIRVSFFFLLLFICTYPDIHYMNTHFTDWPNSKIRFVWVCPVGLPVSSLTRSRIWSLFRISFLYLKEREKWKRKGSRILCWYFYRKMVSEMLDELDSILIKCMSALYNVP